jgi:hypothetical protein
VRNRPGENLADTIPINHLASLENQGQPPVENQGQPPVENQGQPPGNKGTRDICKWQEAEP